MTINTEDLYFPLEDDYILHLEQFGAYCGMPVYHYIIEYDEAIVFYDDVPEYIKEEAEKITTVFDMKIKLLS